MRKKSEREGWIVDPQRAWAMRFFSDSHNKFKPYVYVHRAFCKNLFLHGLTPDAVIIESKNISRQEAIKLWAELIRKGWQQSKPLWLH